MDVLTVREITGPCILNAAHCAKLRLVEKPIGSGTAICPKGASAGEVADIVIFGFVLSSTLVEGHQYQTAQGQTRALKELEVLPIQQEFERLTAMLGACTNGKIATIPITEEGALTFSTKHTTVDEDGNPDKKSMLLMYLIYRIISTYNLRQRLASAGSSSPRRPKPLLATLSIRT